jgi:hypothetical protein
VFGGDLLLRYNWLNRPCWRLDLIGGYQFTRIDDQLGMHSSSVQLAGTFPPGTSFNFQDNFEVRNDFHGMPLGLMADYEYGPWSVSILAKIALGTMHENVSTYGASSISYPGSAAPTTSAGGLYVQGTNAGSYNRHQFTCVPEIGVNVGYQLTSWCTITLGYSAIYWSNVALAGDQIDRGVNGSQLLGGTLAGPARPAAANRDTSFWVHGFQIGAALQF